MTTHCCADRTVLVVVHAAILHQAAPRSMTVRLNAAQVERTNGTSPKARKQSSGLCVDKINICHKNFFASDSPAKTPAPRVADSPAAADNAGCSTECHDALKASSTTPAPHNATLTLLSAHFALIRRKISRGQRRFGSQRFGRRRYTRHNDVFTQSGLVRMRLRTRVRDGGRGREVEGRGRRGAAPSARHGRRLVRRTRLLEILGVQSRFSAKVTFNCPRFTQPMSLRCTSDTHKDSRSSTVKRH